MARFTSPTCAFEYPRFDRRLLTSAVALALVALPVGMSADGTSFDWQTALARSDNANGGNAGDNGKGHGRGGRGGGQGLDDADVLHRRGHGHDKVGGPADPHDLQEFVDGVRSGKAFGVERRDERIAEAMGRYQAALGKHQADSGPDEGTTVAYGFSAEETTSLIERGWQGAKTGDGDFRNHGERTRTMVELSKQLDLGARVGAMQANFGTPFENGIADLQAELTAAEEAGDEAEVERLQGELAAAIEQAKPGVGPDDGWATADLDVNDDGVVDQHDLDALAEGDVEESEPEQEQVAEQSS